MKWRCNDLHIYGELTGDGVEVILFLHGFTGSHKNWLPFIPYVNPYYRTLIIDLIGHGQTDAPNDPTRYDIQKCANDLIRLIDILQLKKVHVLGYSMGGRVALTLASLYPERIASLFLESTTPGLQSEEERLERIASDHRLADMIENDGLPAFIQYWEQIPLFASQATLSSHMKIALRKQRLEHNPLGLANSLRGMGTGAMPSWWGHLSSFQMPVQIVTGELDTKYCLIGTKMREQNHRFSHVVIPNAGHTVHLEKPNDFANLLLQFYLPSKSK